MSIAEPRPGAANGTPPGGPNGNAYNTHTRIGVPADAARATDDADMLPDTDLNPDVDVEKLRHGSLLLRANDLAPDPTVPINYITFYTHRRHRTDGLPRPRDPRDAPDWRMKDRLRTIVASLTLCLNIGVEPPDANRAHPSANLLCWLDPNELDSSKALNTIGRALQTQFETLSTRTRYKVFPDPIVEEMKRNCANQRRVAKDERVLFYYNGYGVPRPTASGEIWVFNRAYTQYIPVTLAELQTSLGSPCIYVWDASQAGNIVNHSHRLAERRAAMAAATAGQDRGASTTHGMQGADSSAAGGAAAGGSPDSFPVRENIHLASCSADEQLPTAPELPADLFTSCLTSPIETSLRLYMIQNGKLYDGDDLKLVMDIPGRLQDRRTPLGELNWIFTSITDTIAWSTLPRPLFRRLFRDDLLVAALMRNFLLAERIMRLYGCTPVSYPVLPDTHNHRMWADWDMALDQMIQQLPSLVRRNAALNDFQQHGTPIPPELEAVEHKSSSFFTDQLSAFEVWILQAGASRVPLKRRPMGDSGVVSCTFEYEDDVGEPVREPPEQLPVVLQVLLSQVHRLRALVLLSSFLDLGPWAVNQALSIGIFPYVLKLLQSPALDLKPVLIYIWARILAVDRSCQYDLLRDDGFKYFSNALSPFYQSQPILNTPAGAHAVWGTPDFPHASEHRAMCAFILSVFCYDYAPGQTMCLQAADVMSSCIEHLDDDDFLLRQWSALCLARLWDGSELGKATALDMDAHGKLVSMLSDPAPEVRSALLYAVGTLLGTRTPTDDIPSTPTSHSLATRAAASDPNTPGGGRPVVLGTGTSTGLPESTQRDVEIGLVVAMLSIRSDPSPLVRREFLIAMSPLVREYTGWFALAMYLYIWCVGKGDAEGASEKLVDPETDELDRFLDQLWAALAQRAPFEETDIDNLSAFRSILDALMDLSVDPFPDVAALAMTQLDYITSHLLSSAAAVAPGSALINLVPPPMMARFFHVDSPPAEQVRAQAQTQGGGQDYFSHTPHPLSAHQGGAQTVPSTPGWAKGGLTNAARALGFDFSRPPSPELGATPRSEGISRLADLSLSPAVTETAIEPAPRLRKPMPPGGGVGYIAPLVETGGVRPLPEGDVMDALAELLAHDLERFRGRGLPTPPDNVVSEAADTLPLMSRLYGWAAEMYTMPQMKDPEPTEPGSVASNVQAYKQHRNDRLVQQGKESAVGAARTPWAGELKSLKNCGVAHHLAFHQFEDHLAVASGEDVVSIWDWRRGKLLNEFSNGNPARTHVTSLAYLNEAADASLLVTGSSDGDVRIFRHYDRYLPPDDEALRTSVRRPTELLAAFHALPDALDNAHPAGLHLDWIQSTGHLLAAGDSPVVRVWDAHRETCVADVPTSMESSVMSLASEKDVGDLFFVGGHDGSVRAFDKRNPPGSAMIRVWEEHRTYIRGVRMQAFGARELVSCAVDGSVRLWDLRAATSVGAYSVQTALRAAVAGFAVHDRVPLLAAMSKPRTNPVGRQGSVSRLSLAGLDAGQPLGQPLQHFTPPGPNFARSPQDLRRAVESSLMRKDPLAPMGSVKYTPPPGCVAFHPQLPLVAYAGPGKTLKLNTPPLPGAKGGWDEDVYAPRPVRDLIMPKDSSSRPAPRSSWIW